MHPALLQLGFLALRCHMQSFLCDSRDWFVINYWVSSFAVCCVDTFHLFTFVGGCYLMPDDRTGILCLMIVLVSYAFVRCYYVMLFGLYSAGMDVIRTVNMCVASEIAYNGDC